MANGMWTICGAGCCRPIYRGEGTVQQLAERFSVSARRAWDIAPSLSAVVRCQMERVELDDGGNCEVNAAEKQLLLRVSVPAPITIELLPAGSNQLRRRRCSNRP